MNNAPTVLIHPHFADRTGAGHVKARFQFSGAGTLRQGVEYVTERLTDDRQADIRRAAAKAAKRMGATEITIHAIGA